MDKTTIWIPQQEADAMKEMNKQLAEESKKLDWAYKAWLQFKIEKGDFDDIEPIIRDTYIRLAYG